MRILRKIIVFILVALATYYLLFVADMTWDANQKKIVPEAENTTEKEFDLNYQVAIEDLPESLVKQMKNQAIIHRAVAEALEENGFSTNEKVRFVKYTQDETTGDMKLYFVFGKNEHRLEYSVVNGTPIKYDLTIVTIVEEE